MSHTSGRRILPKVFFVLVVTEDQRGPAVHASLQAFVEDLVQEEDRLAVEEDGADVLVRARRLLEAGRHFEGPVEARHQDLQLGHVLLLVFQHPEHQTGVGKSSQRRSISSAPKLT